MKITEITPSLLDGKTLRSESCKSTIRLSGMALIVEVLYDTNKKEVGASPYHIGLDTLEADDWICLPDERTPIEKIHGICNRAGVGLAHVPITQREIEFILSLYPEYEKLKLS